MKSLFLLFTIVTAAVQLPAQTEFSPDDYFPAEGEFVQLQQIQSEETFSDPAPLNRLENGTLISDVGFRDYSQRIYGVEDSSRLSIEIITLIDYRAAFSLLSLLRSSPIAEKGLGDAHATVPGEVLFCQGRKFVRVLGPGSDDGLLGRVAGSVSRRIGVPEGKLPSLLSYLPETGLQTDSLEYFPSIKTYETFREISPDRSVAQRFEMEIARANYAEGDLSGVLCLMKFPTTEMAEDYYEYLSSPVPDSLESGTYFKMSGPLLSVLKGSFPTRNAGDLLDLIGYGYSVQWIRDSQPQTTIAWGIPVQILNTTVYSFFFVLFLCIFSILAGSILAGLRIFLRLRLPNNPLDDPKRTGIIRLKLS